MDNTNTSSASPGNGVPVAPTLHPALLNEGMGEPRTTLGIRTLYIGGLSLLIGAMAALVARLLTSLIGLVTNLAYFHHFSLAMVDPVGHHLGWWAVGVPVAGGLVVGVMARYGSAAIRGHGIPEAMEQVLLNQSRIPARVTLLKPLSAAIAIGTGGPFGAEGPIIATGGALGSLLGQALRVSGTERKTLLAAGAAAGMAATFGTPVAAVLLAVELLLFELRPRSVVPVAMAAVCATAMRGWMMGPAPAFAMPATLPATPAGVVGYALLGAVVGLCAVAVTRLLYAIEDGFARLPIHWMWWPAIGAVAVGMVGMAAPATLGVGYSNIEGILSGSMTTGVVAFLCAMKLVSWSISLGSGTSGGTLAPLFTIGGGLGMVLAMGFNAVWPEFHLDPRVAGLVGMAAMFAGASRAFLASVVFAFETTQNPVTLLPLLAGGTSGYLVGLLLMKHSIMTEKIARRGVRVASEYSADFLDQCPVASHATRQVITIRAEQSVQEVLDWLDHAPRTICHQGFPVVDAQGRLQGLAMRHELTAAVPDQLLVRDLLHRGPVVVGSRQSLRQAADLMVAAGVGRLLVVQPNAPDRLWGILSRSDILRAHALRLQQEHPVPTRETAGNFF